jgi:CO dehydrogenase nickel-insertion accessory protein CooC1
MKALEAARHIHGLASNAGLKQIFLVGNRIGSDAQRSAVESYADKYGLKVLDFVPFDPLVAEAEMQGETPLRNEESIAMKAIEKLREELETNICSG